MVEVGAYVLGAEQGGIGFPDLGGDLCGSGSGGHDLQVGDVGNDTVHWEVLVGIAPQC